MAKSVTAHLERAGAALEAGSPGAALDALLQAWRLVPHDATARLVCALGRRVRPAALDGTGARTRAADWDRRASERQAADLTLLLDELLLTSAQATALRLEALTAWPPDPRFAEAALRFYRSPPFSTFGQRVFWDTLEALLALGPAPTLAAELDQLELPPDLGVVRESARAVALASSAHFPAGAPPLRRADRALCESMVRFCGASDPARAALTEQEFLDRIYAAERSNEARLVYADWLQERGDPRGEFIALQCRTRRSPREEELLRLHAKKWLGPLGAVVQLSGLAFERGFPVAGQLVGTVSELRRVAGHAAWATFRKLDVSRVPSHEPAVEQMVVGLSKRGIVITGLGGAPHLAGSIERGGRSAVEEDLALSLLEGVDDDFDDA